MNISTSREHFIPLIVLAGLGVGIGLLMANTDFSWQGLVLVLAGLGILAVIIVPRLARQEADTNLLKVLFLALILKLIFSMIRNWFAFGVYGGTADASLYNRMGTMVANYIRTMDFGSLASFMRTGTTFVEFFTGIIYTITGPNIYGGYLIYAFLAFIGSYYYYRAFQIAFPYGNTRLFLILIFFLPSILYWANGIGKDALMSLFIGISAYGVARLVRNGIRGLLPMAFGLAGTACIRPHITIVLALAIGLALIMRRVGKGSAGIATQAISLIAIFAFIWFLVPRMASELGIQELSTQGLVTSFMQQQDFSFQGGSAYQVVDITDPRLPITLASLVFRPFPWEAHNLQTLVQSFEGLLLIGLVLWRIRSIGIALKASFSDAFIRYILISLFGLLMTYTSIANYGILVRERAMMLPFLLMLIAYDIKVTVPAPGVLITKRSEAAVGQRP